MHVSSRWTRRNEITSIKHPSSFEFPRGLDHRCAKISTIYAGRRVAIIIYARRKLGAKVNARAWPVEKGTKAASCVRMINDIARRLLSCESDFANVSATPLALILINR